MKRSREGITTFQAKKQQNIAGFFVKTKVGESVDVKEQDKPDIIDLSADIDDLKAPVAKSSPLKAVYTNFATDDYPPVNHPSYHLPPSSSFNHPFIAPPIPDSLISSLKFNTSSKSITKPELGLDLLYFKPFIERSSSRDLMKFLLDSLPWYRVKYVVRGISINTPRWTTVFGKDRTGMAWEKYGCKPRAIPPILLRLMQKVEEATGETYNFVLVNYYSTGSDSISFHSDSESFLGSEPCIASLSLGAPRDFHLRHIKYKEKSLPLEKYSLESGDMVVMRGRTQHDWQHAVPKRAKAEGRINITFRKGVVEYATKNYNQYNVGSGGMYRWIKGEMVEQT